MRSRGTVQRVTGALVGALLLAACGSSTSTDPGGAAAPARGATHPSTAPSTGTAAVADHTVGDPGKFRPPTLTADILVFGQEALKPATIRRIRHLPGVRRVESFSLAQISIENHAIRVAAVDPATYRNYNPAQVAQFQPEWDRIAAGEMALRPSFRRQVGADGSVLLGANADAPRIHVGAYAPQIPQVDAIVNTTWAAQLGMVSGNALLVSTGFLRTPLSLRRPIERLVGHDASVTSMDAAARYGLDPSVAQSAVVAGTVGDAVGAFSYSVLGGGRIAPQPSWVASHISPETMPIIGPMTCNTLLFPQLKAALEEILTSNLASKIIPSQYAGCYNARFIAGTTTLSNHAFGLAFDLNTPGNQRGTVGEMDPGVVAIFEKWGFTWGGTWHYTDPMHFELNRVVRPS